MTTSIRLILLPTLALALFWSLFVVKLNYSKAEDINVNALVVDSTPPNAIIDAPDKALTNQDILMSASASTDSEGIVRYEWIFGDDSSHATTKNVHKSYNKAGVYSISLTASDAAGNNGTAQKNIQINNRPPVIPGITEKRVNEFIGQAKVKKIVKAMIIIVILAIILLYILTGYLNIIRYIQYLILMILALFGIRKRRTPWGIVYNATTKQPVYLAAVKIYTTLNEFKENCITNKKGQFGFVVPPGAYHLVVTKTGYSWPSKVIPENVTEDGSFQNVYHDSNFSTKHTKNDIEINIPIDPMSLKDKIGQYQWWRIIILVKEDMPGILSVLIFINLIALLLFKDFFAMLGEILFISLLFFELKDRKSIAKLTEKQ